MNLRPYSEGPLDASICIIGEAPGELEAAIKRPFVGHAGKLLDQCLASAGVLRSACRIENVFQFRPPSNNITPYLSFSLKGVRESEEYKGQRAALKEALQACSASVFVPLGNTALYSLTGKTSITKWRGSLLESILLPGRKCVPSIHPAAALRNYLDRFLIAHDLVVAKEESVFPEYSVPQRVLITYPSFNECLEYIERCRQAPLVAFDIEVMNEEVSCISFALAGDDAICIPFTTKGQLYFTPPQERTIWRHITDLLEDETVRKLGQNLAFDTCFLYRKLGIRVRPIDDTMVGQAIAFPDFDKGLGFITSMYTRQPYYKDDGKQWFKRMPGGSEKGFFEYNALDSAVCMEAFPKILQELESQRNANTYVNQVLLIEPLTFIASKGIRMDLENIHKSAKEENEEIARLEADLSQLVGPKYNSKFVGSSKQLQQYFYVEKRYKAITYKGRVTCDEKALKKLAAKGSKEARLIMAIRKRKKLVSTYYNMTFDADGRLRCSYNPVGTSQGRISSSKTIFGTGGNLQNQPPAMKRYMLADDGMFMLNMDLSQAENRVVGYVSGEERMIYAFESGKDIHRLTASLIFGVPPEQISDEKGSCPIGSGRDSQRDWGKRANHSLNYDIGPSQFAAYYEIPIKDAEFLINAYHAAYPSVRQWHTRVRDQLNKDRTLTNCMGRRRIFRDRWDTELFKLAYSFIPQSTVADKLNRDGLAYAYYNMDACKDVCLINQVHDSIVWEYPIDNGPEALARTILAIKGSLESPIYWQGRAFRIPSDCTIGFNLGKYHIEKNPKGQREVKVNAAETCDELARRLHDLY